MIASLCLHIKIPGPAGGTLLVGVARVPSPLWRSILFVLSMTPLKHIIFLSQIKGNPQEKPFMPLGESSELGCPHEEESQVHQWAEDHYPASENTFNN